MTDKIEVSQRAREAAAALWESKDGRVSVNAANTRLDGMDDLPTVQAFARFERDILATRTDATPVAWMYYAEDGQEATQPLKNRLVPNTMGWTETPLYPDPPATDVAEQDATAAALIQAAFADREARLVGALEDVINPLGYLKRHAEAKGSQLNGMAYQIANDPSFAKSIANEALAALRTGHMDKIEVTQADREAAAIGYYDWVSATQTVPNRMQAGEADFHSMVQAFARHRLATRTDATPVARKQFPILGSRGAKIDLQLVEDHGKQVYSNHYQTVERLAERGGLSWCELHAVLNNRPWQKMDENTAIAECRAIEARYLGAFNPPATDVATLVEAAKAMFEMPGDIDIESNPPELQREALEARRQAWNALRSALAPFTKGQP